MSVGRLSPSPSEVFGRLLRAYGPQGWWPVTVGRGVAPRYRPGFKGALSERQRAEICVGAILTQNTSWLNVLRALESLHDAGIRSLERLAAVPRARLERLIRSSGYFRQKARKLRAFAIHARKRKPLSRWLSGELAPLRAELLSLWGVGPETADSILLYAGGRAVFVVDAYTLRLGRRLGWFSARPSRDPYHDAQRRLAAELPVDAALYAEQHALIVEHAKRYCRTTPLCPDCPLLEVCPHGRSAVSRLS